MDSANLPLLSFEFDTVECKLIYLVKLHPELYDSSLESYHNMELKLAIFGKIGQELGKDQDWCVYKWVTLFARYAKRRTFGKNGEEWPYDNAMKFLDQFPLMSSLTPKYVVSGYPGKRREAGSSRGQSAGPCKGHQFHQL